jgi:hypothetical protein
MKRGTSIVAVALVLGAFACDRRSETKPSDTTTTSGTVDQAGARPSDTGATSPSIVGGGTTGSGTGTNAGTGSSFDRDLNFDRNYGVAGGKDGGVAIDTGNRDFVPGATGASPKAKTDDRSFDKGAFKKDGGH